MTAVLQRVLNVEKEEVGPILMAAFYFFCILVALQILRPAREALGLQRGIEAIRWLFNATLIITLFVNPVFGWLVSRFRKMTFIATMYLFFAANLMVFYGLLVFAPAAVGEVSGMVFYVWMSVFNLFVTMIFWGLMADRFSYEQSKRLFGAIAVGGTVGAMTGSAQAWVLAERIGTPALLVIAAVFLTMAVAAAFAVNRMTAGWQPTEGETLAAAVQNQRIGGSAWEGFRSVFRSRYLLGISAYVLILAVLVTFVYFTRLQMVAALGDDLDMRTGVFGQLDFLTQATTLVLQALVAGHLMKRLGVAVTLAITPVIVALGFIGLAIVGSLAFLIIFDAVFRATQRAIMRPARETLFTVVSLEDKYKAKAFTDTFVYRGGDAVGAWTEGLLGRVGMALGGLAAVAAPLALAWAALGIWLGRQQTDLADQPPPPRRGEPVPAGGQD
ncbi:MAG TPA: MFS transporter [Longimicrobiales bacterium]|nr:MFS transporter [Longimicrobiales bacterium]